MSDTPNPPRLADQINRPQTGQCDIEAQNSPTAKLIAQLTRERDEARAEVQTLKESRAAAVTQEQINRNEANRLRGELANAAKMVDCINEALHLTSPANAKTMEVLHSQILGLLMAYSGKQADNATLAARCKELEQEKVSLKEKLAALEADKRRLVEAASLMLGNYLVLKAISLRAARSDNPNWIGRDLKPEDDIHVIGVRAAIDAAKGSQ